MRQRHCNIMAAAIAVAMAIVPVCGWGKVVRAKSTQSSGVLTLECDSVDFRPDLVRVYGRLVGTPHTSHRIDSLSVEYPVKKASTDIDGVDMKRWFQWEDEGELPVEIDFPPMKKSARMDINAVTPRGVAGWRIILNNKR